MSRRRRSLSIAAVVVAVLVAPAAASAATYTIKSGDGACGPGDLACGGFVEAAAVATAGDIFNVTAGIYPGATFAAPGLTINGAPGVLVNTTLSFTGTAGAVSKVSKINVVATAGPAIVVTGTAGIELSDAVAVSQNDHGIFISAGQTNKLVRTVAATGGGATSAIRVLSEESSGAKSVTMDSVLATGGGSAIGAFTQSAPLLPGAAGDITLIMRHVTTGGATNGIVLNSSAGANALNDGAGNITATVTDSLALRSSTTHAVGLLGIGDNTATLNTTRTLLEGDEAALFAAPTKANFRLRPGSPAIGQGSVTAGESATDIDGEDRSTAPTDLGADEFNNAPPVAKVAVKTATPRATQAVTFDGSGSSDREAAYGGGIVEYRWTFSDGKAETTSGPTVSHAFPKEGDASVQLIVVDRQGAGSAPATAAFKLIDGTPPTVGIVKPKNNQKIKRFTTNKKTKKRTRTKIVFGGLSADANGVAQIVLTLEKLSDTKSTKCNWYNPAKGIVRRSCQKPVLFSAKLVKDSKTGEWSYTVRRNLNKGKYRLTAVGADKTGAVGNAGGTKLGVVRFTLV
jgi:uncharacterized membrane protein YtjA (UPF0391 family)